MRPEGGSLLPTMCAALHPYAISRRRFCVSIASASFASAVLLARSGLPQAAEGVHFNVADYDRAHILTAAAEALRHSPSTVTSSAAPGKGLDAHTYYSEDIAWWPREDDSKAPYERRQGYSNPHAFTAHRDALVRLNGTVSASVAAWRLTGEVRYAEHAMLHLRAWFLDEATRMEPGLEHAACIPPSVDGTPAGVEDAVVMAEIVRGASFLCAYNGVATEAEAAGLRAWFSAFATWLNESKKGAIAREAKDRLAVCWALQAAECARFARMGALQLECSHRFRDKLLRQMSFDGDFPAELHRADAYSSSIFTLECLSLTCEALSSPMDRLWDYNLPDGRGMRSAVAFLYPALDRRAAWRYPADAEHFGDWPVRGASLLLAGRAYSRTEYIATWKRLPPEPRSPDLLRFVPSRQPALWTTRVPG